MNVLFLTLLDFNTVKEHTIYTDILRVFIRNGHKICAISPVERRKHEQTNIIKEHNCHILKLKIGSIQKANIIEKGINTLRIESQFIDGIKKYFGDIRFDLVLYATPPVTFVKVVEYVKKRDGARSYLMLKDIFPQNALDLGMMSEKGILGLLYRKFRTQEKKLYAVSDRIGCMSGANVTYILEHNTELRIRQEEATRKKTTVVEVCPNCIEPTDEGITSKEREQIRRKYGVPIDRNVFVYGGNLGKPQGISFMLKCLHSQYKNPEIFFLIVGNGTEYPMIEQYIERYKPENVRLYKWLPKDIYDKVVASSDVGMIFLDHRFTIPNFPSRLLGYMNAHLPVLAVTDTATDIGKVITEGGFGWWCESNDTKAFSLKVRGITKLFSSDADARKRMGDAAWEWLNDHYTDDKAYKKITTWKAT
ncbi:MAG: glycosyltransferase family 4 protein [Lachnospiraceae bacterium]|nr:glycosyltransferase family 4 protein [Lachnospiraceae bacterium]